MNIKHLLAEYVAGRRPQVKGPLTYEETVELIHQNKRLHQTLKAVVEATPATLQEQNARVMAADLIEKGEATWGQ